MHIYELIQLYWADIAIVAIFTAVMALLIKKGKADLVRRIVYALVVDAEKILGSGTGSEKKAWVIAAIYIKLPYLLKLIFTQQDMERFIEEGVKRLKVALDTGQFNLLGYAEELIINQNDNQSTKYVNR